MSLHNFFPPWSYLRNKYLTKLVWPNLWRKVNLLGLPFLLPPPLFLFSLPYFSSSFTFALIFLFFSPLPFPPFSFPLSSLFSLLLFLLFKVSSFLCACYHGKVFDKKETTFNTEVYGVNFDLWRRRDIHKDVLYWLDQVRTGEH